MDPGYGGRVRVPAVLKKGAEDAAKRRIRHINIKGYKILYLKFGFCYIILYLCIAKDKKMKRYKVKQVLDLLRKDGWEIKRTKGDHRQLKNTKGKPGTVTVNGKESENLSQELLNSIWKQAGWK